MNGVIFNIQRFSVHDGPGIRTNLFLKGCPLRCVWCHNPEGLSVRPDLSYIDAKCIGCGACAGVCPNGVHVFEGERHLLRREVCVSCGKCAENCAYGALEIMGKTYAPEEAVRLALRDKPFFGSEGGVTLTGGEPMAQAEFAAEVAQMLCKQGISVCMETSGYAKREDYAKILPYIDRFLFDIKETDEARHRQFTGVSMEKIHDNLDFLDENGAKIVLRCPIILNVNLRESHFEAIAELANAHKNVLEIDMEPYHPLGLGKAKHIGAELRYANENPLDKSDVEPYLEKMRQKTAVPILME